MNTPYWEEKPVDQSYPPLERDLEVDVLVVGGGITGVTTAYLLAKAGKKVALVERGELASGETSHTTAHLTYMTDTRLSDVVSKFGKDEAKLAWRGGQAAMDFIHGTVAELGIDCELAIVPGYLAVSGTGDVDKDTESVKEEARMAKEMGFNVQFVDWSPPHSLPAMMFHDQLKFHPLLYLKGLLAEAARLGVSIHEHSEAGDFKKRQATVNGHTVRYRSVVIATHVPMQGSMGALGAAMFQTKISGYSTYAIGAEVPAGSLPEMIRSDTSDPFLYLRVDPGEEKDFVVLGGEDHKTGQLVHTEEAFRNLKAAMSRMVDEFEVTHHWSGQVIETVDGLPYIGFDDSGQFISTGFSGNGLTYGTLAALMARDALTGQPNQWVSLFAVNRKKLSALPEYLAENKDFPVRMVTDRLADLPTDMSQVARGEGCLMKIDGERAAVYRDEKGEVHACSAICPHLGGVVAWNEAEKTWDCPCHGSRFTPTGEVIAGPAEKSLKQLEPAAH